MLHVSIYNLFLIYVHFPSDRSLTFQLFAWSGNDHDAGNTLQAWP